MRRYSGSERCSICWPGDPRKCSRKKPEIVDELIASAVRIKAEVVSADERESDLRRILNFGHTIGHAIEAETEYIRFLHGEAIAWGMLAATRLSELLGMLNGEAADNIRSVICQLWTASAGNGIEIPSNLISRLAGDKKTLQGNVHFVLPTAIGEVKVVGGDRCASDSSSDCRILAGEPSEYRNRNNATRHFE